MKILSKWTLGFLLVAVMALALSGCSGSAGLQGPVGPQGPAGSAGVAGAAGAAGVSITGASVNNTGHLVLALSNGQTIDAGSISNQQNAAINLPSFASLISAVKPSVVEINVTATVGTGRRTVQQQGAGSGWILDANGTIVTNNHVVTGATTIIVTTSDGKTFPAQVINTDPVNDLAVIKINATQLQSLKIGDASKLLAGDWVLAVGNPLGEGITATQGIVSRVGVSVPYSQTQTYNDLIETTAPINPGNSGGPLINLAGEVVGITTLGANGVQGMGYAISMVDALPVIQKLLK
jgi:serine protease Do